MEGATNPDIMGYSFSSSSTFTVCNTQNQEWFPETDDQYVAWEYLSNDNTFIRNICYKSIPDGATFNISFNPFITSGSVSVKDNYISLLADSGLSRNPNTAEIKIYNMTSDVLEKIVTLSYNNSIITGVRGFSLGKISTDVSSLKCLLASFDELKYSFYLVDPKIGLLDPPAITPIEPVLPPGDVINAGVTCPINSLNHLFLVHGASFPKIGETSGESWGNQNLSFYDLDSNTLYPIITNNTAYAFYGKAIEKNSKIIVPIALRWNDVFLVN